jgi:hypothetical protein
VWYNLARSLACSWSDAYRLFSLMKDLDSRFPDCDNCLHLVHLINIISINSIETNTKIYGLPAVSALIFTFVCPSDVLFFMEYRTHVRHWVGLSHPAVHMFVASIYKTSHQDSERIRSFHFPEIVRCTRKSSKHKDFDHFLSQTHHPLLLLFSGYLLEKSSFLKVLTRKGCRSAWSVAATFEATAAMRTHQLANNYHICDSHASNANTCCPNQWITGMQCDQKMLLSRRCHVYLWCSALNKKTETCGEVQDHWYEASRDSELQR